MKTVEKFVKALQTGIRFVDLFGDNLGGDKLKDCVQLSTESGKVVITNKYGTTKTFTFGNAHLKAIFDEISANLESFKPNYPGYLTVHTGAHGGKIITTISSKIILDEKGSTNERVAVIFLKGKEVYTRYEITETFHQDF